VATPFGLVPRPREGSAPRKPPITYHLFFASICVNLRLSRRSEVEVGLSAVGFVSGRFVPIGSPFLRSLRSFAAILVCSSPPLFASIRGPALREIFLRLFFCAFGAFCGYSVFGFELA